MKVLVYGAGVLGSLYAARLRDAGVDATILARGRRLQYLCENGIVLRSAYTGRKTVHEVPVVDKLDPELRWDLVLVAVRNNQIASSLKDLAAAKTENLLFLGNNVNGTPVLTEALGAERVLLGFPGAGGILEDDVVVYIDSEEGSSKTWGLVIGEIDGSATARLGKIKALFEGASVPAEIASNICAWLVTHANVAVPIAYALYLIDGGLGDLAERADVLRLLIFAIREGFTVQEALGIPVTPARMRLYKRVPAWVLNGMLRSRFRSRMAEIGIQGHALAAPDEMNALALDLQELIRRASLPTPALRTLYNIEED